MLQTSFHYCRRGDALHVWPSRQRHTGPVLKCDKGKAEVKRSTIVHSDIQHRQLPIDINIKSSSEMAVEQAPKVLARRQAALPLCCWLGNETCQWHVARTSAFGPLYFVILCSRFPRTSSRSHANASVPCMPALTPVSPWLCSCQTSYYQIVVQAQLTRRRLPVEGKAKPEL